MSGRGAQASSARPISAAGGPACCRPGSHGPAVEALARKRPSPRSAKNGSRPVTPPLPRPRAPRSPPARSPARRAPPGCAPPGREPAACPAPACAKGGTTRPAAAPSQRPAAPTSTIASGRAVQRLVELQHGLEAARVRVGEGGPLRPRACPRRRLELGAGGAGRGGARRGRAARARRTGRARTSARAPPSATHPSAQHTAGSRRGRPPSAQLAAARAPDRRASTPAATIASQRWEAAVMATSTTWPSPERSRSHSAAMIPNAAVSAPPPTSATGTAGATGGPPGAPVSAEHAGAREVAEVVAGAVAVRPVLPEAGDRADDEPRVLRAQPLVAEAEAVEHAGAEGLEQDVVLAHQAQEHLAPPSASGRAGSSACRGSARGTRRTAPRLRPPGRAAASSAGSRRPPGPRP